MSQHIKLYLLSLAMTLGSVYHTYAQDTLHMHITVHGSCGMCTDRITGIADGQDKAVASSWDPSDLVLHLDYLVGFDSMALHQALADAGHDTHLIKATEKAYNSLHTCCQYRSSEIEETQASRTEDSDEQSIHTDIVVNGICGMCQERIEAVANKHNHVLEANWEIETNILHVDHTAKFNSNSLQRAIARVGHDTEFMKAPAFAYNELHECCKYRDQEVINSHNPDGSMVDEFEENANLIQGIILEQDDTGTELPIIGANVYWAGTTTGTTTDIDGYFSLDKAQAGTPLVVSYVGYNNDTLMIADKKHVEIVLSDATMMREVTITYRKRSTDVSFLSTGKMQVIGEKELLKAACCNLSESFDTNPTVDASATDAVTGTRQIKMLGLAGPNIQITREGIPDIRGLSAIYGLTFTPGPWIQSININTGAGSVVNGFESIAGQIDVSLKKPDQSERFYLNLYGNGMSRQEANVNFSHRFNDNVSTGLLLHGNRTPQVHDNNFDNFLDHPIQEQYIGINRWKFYGKDGLEGQFGVKVTSLDTKSGQVGFDHETDKGSEHVWGARIGIKKYEGWAKIGKVFPSKPYASVGLQLAGSYFEQDAYFGHRDFDGKQTSLYSNLIYQSIITDTRHNFKTGLSFQYDLYDENVNQAEYDRKEVVPGAFFEYQFEPNERLSIVAGLRGDVHNNYGAFVTPRLHVRYKPNDETVFRLSGGRGQRTASIFAEQIGAFATSRQFIVEMEDVTNPYGLDAEVSWTAGFNFARELKITDRSILFQFDVYHTNFSNQIVADYDASPQQLRFYNLDGKSYSNSIQVQADYELLPGFDVRLAYRFNDVKTTYGDQTLEKPLTGRERAFMNLQYETKNSWSFDFTLNWQGAKRLPSTLSNPEQYQVDAYSPSYFMSNMQISKSWNKKFDIYIGAMDLFDYKQDDPIISVDNPFSDYFDSSIVWAPIFGREIYAGIRYRLK